MSEKDLNWRFSQEIVIEDDVIERTRILSLEHGVEPISATIGSQCALIACATRATSMIEIGTGFGVSGLWLMNGSPDATLTSIDQEREHQEHARSAFTEAGYSANKIRLITGKANDVLPRMNELSYDVVLVDANADSVIEYVEHGIRLAKSGGVVLVPHALWKDRVADPSKRDEISETFRSLLNEVYRSRAIVTCLSTNGDGLLQIAKK